MAERSGIVAAALAGAANLGTAEVVLSSEAEAQRYAWFLSPHAGACRCGQWPVGEEVLQIEDYGGTSRVKSVECHSAASCYTSTCES